MEMAEAPVLSQRAKDLGWHIIQGSDWAPRKLCEVNAKYRGDSEDHGRLDKRNGWGEYLDVKAIIEAKNYVDHAVERDLPNYDMPAKLQLKQLRLSGFVVDGKLPSNSLSQRFTDSLVPKLSSFEHASMKTCLNRSISAGTVWMEVLR